MNLTSRQQLGVHISRVALTINVEELHDEITSFPHSGLLVGTSRKRFLGSITGRNAAERDIATAATSVAARLKGACVFRVHNVAVNKDALAVADALINIREMGAEEATFLRYLCLRLGVATPERSFPGEYQ